MKWLIFTFVSSWLVGVYQTGEIFWTTVAAIALFYLFGGLFDDDAQFTSSEFHDD